MRQDPPLVISEAILIIGSALNLASTSTSSATTYATLSDGTALSSSNTVEYLVTANE